MKTLAEVSLSIWRIAGLDPLQVEPSWRYSPMFPFTVAVHQVRLPAEALMHGSVKVTELAL